MMLNSSNTKRITGILSNASFTVISLYYLWWFRLAPPLRGDDPTPAFILGIILLAVHMPIAWAIQRSKSLLASFALYCLGVSFLLINSVYLYTHIPRLGLTAKCNGVTYYWLHGAALFDEQWRYVQLTKWWGWFDFETYSFGYDSSAAANAMACDTDQKETIFIKNYPALSALTFVDGKNPKRFYVHAGAKLDNDLYFLAEDWSIENCTTKEYWDCDIFTYTLYKCDGDFTHCNPLPLSYSSGEVDYLQLRVDDSTKQVLLIEESYYGEYEDIVVFSYGEIPNCYVDGCTLEDE